jgi:hypothetical protein
MKPYCTNSLVGYTHSPILGSIIHEEERKQTIHNVKSIKFYSGYQRPYKNQYDSGGNGGSRLIISRTCNVVIRIEQPLQIQIRQVFNFAWQRTLQVVV